MHDRCLGAHNARWTTIDQGVLVVTSTFRAADVPATSRNDYWNHVAMTAVGVMDLRVTSEVDVRDQLLVGELGAVRVGKMSTYQEGGARRTAKLIRQDDPDFCKIDILARGQGVVAQDRREALLRPGDLVFVDLSKPADWRMSAMEIVAVSFPRTLLPLRPDDLSRLTGVSIPGDRGTASLISSLALQLPEHLDYAGAGTRLGTAVLDLLTAGMAARLDRESAVPPETRQHAMLVRIRAWIEEHLCDPRLSPSDVAAAHHISLRYLHKLFAGEPSTVAGWIRWRRLEHCRRELRDPTQAMRPVSAIAARWGILNAAHFSRVFRDTYGLAPAEYRRLHLGL
jgi:AraC-like DNA-binding protein